MIIGAYGTGASEGVIYVRNEYPLAIKHLLIALRQARELGLLGECILGTAFSFEIRLVSSRAESESLTDRLSVIESDLAQAHANAEAQLNWHKMELARQDEAGRPLQQPEEGRPFFRIHRLAPGRPIPCSGPEPSPAAPGHSGKRHSESDR
jgi:hypothetical protein